MRHPSPLICLHPDHPGPVGDSGPTNASPSRDRDTASASPSPHLTIAADLARLRRRDRHFQAPGPPGLPRIAASILSADFGHIADECRAVIAAGADMLHLDVMDGHFVPNLTMGPDMCHAARRACPDAFLDVHLMVSHPGGFIKPFAEAGADLFTVHIEASEVHDDDLGGPRAMANRIRAAGMLAGIAINPPTPFVAIEPWIEAFDLVLVMSVNPGYSGQSFIADVLTKATKARAMARPNQRVEIDGGVKPANARACIDAGCDVLAAASAIFGRPRDAYAAAVEALRRPM